MVKTQGKSKKRTKKGNFQEDSKKSRIRNREGWRKWRMESAGCAELKLNKSLH